MLPACGLRAGRALGVERLGERLAASRLRSYVGVQGVEVGLGYGLASGRAISSVPLGRAGCQLGGADALGCER